MARVLLVLLLAAPMLFAQADEPATNTWAVDGTVFALEKSGGTTYIGGNFDWVGPNTGSLIGADAATGTLDATFPKANGPVNAVISDGAGGWFVGGAFTKIGTQARAGLAHILASKVVDASFATGVIGSVNSLVLDGSVLYVGGQFSKAGALDRDNIAALDASSGAVLSFNPAVVGAVFALALDSGTLYLGGDFTFVAGQPRARLAAVSAPAGVLTAWDPGANNTVRAIVVNGATAYAGGDFTQVGGASGNPLQARSKFAAFSTVAAGPTISVGSVSFSPSTVRALALAGNTLYLGGLAANVSLLGRVAVLDATTGLPAVGVANPDNEVRCSLPDGSGGWYLGGTFSTIGGVSRARLAHVTAAGAVDTAFNFTAGSIMLNAVNALATDGTYLYAAGDLPFGGFNYVLQLDPASGAWITSWNLRVQGGEVQALAVAGGQLFVGGTYFQINGNTVQAPWDNLAAVDLATGDPNSNISGATGSGATVRALAISGSTVFVGGFFANLNGSTRTHFGALDVATGAVAAFDPAPNGQVRALAVGGGALYVGGSFATISAVPRQRLAKYDLPALTLNAWSPGANSQVSALAVGGSLVYVGGVFTTLGGAARIAGGALDASTGAPAAFNPGISSSVVLTIALQGTQALFAGQFTSFALQSRGNGLALDLASGTYTAWNPVANGRIDALSLLGTSVYCGGVFTTLGGQPRSGLGAVNASSGAPLSFVCDNSGGVSAIMAQGASVVAGGTFNGAGGRRQADLASVDTATGVVSAWAPQVNGTVQTLKLAGTTLYVGGGFTLFDGQPRSRAAAVDVATLMLTTFAPQSDGTVYALEVSGSTVYMGGSFTHLDRSVQQSMAVLNATSSAAVPTAVAVGQWVYSIVPAPGGGWFVGGSFTTVNGLPRSGLVKLFADGSVDTTFTIEADGSVHGLAVISNRLFLAGTFSMVGGQNRPFLAAIDLSTTTVNAWTPAPSSQVYEIASSGNTLYVGGVFNTIAGQARNYLASFDAVTLAINAWNPSPNNQIFGLAAYGSTVFVSGPFTTIGGQSRARLAAIDATGAAMSFNPAPDNTTSALAVAGSTLYVGGDFLNIASQPRTRLAAFDASTFALLSFDPGANATVQTLATTATRLYVGGDFTTLGGQQRGAGGAFDLATSTLLAFDCSVGSGSIYAIAEDSGRVCIGGPFDDAGGTPRTNVCAVNATTGLVLSFAPQIDGLVRSLGIEGNSLFAGGEFSNVNTQPRRGLCEFTLSTGALTSFDAQLNGAVRTLLVKPAFVYAGGQFSLASGSPHGRVVRLNRTTGAATAWGPYLDNDVLALAENGPLIYLAGTFTGNGELTGAFVKLDASSAAPDASFPVVAGQVSCAVPDGSGGWYIGGSFTSVGGVARQGLARILANNTVDSAFAPVVNNGAVLTMLVDNNRLFIGGNFTQISGSNRFRLAALDLNAGAGYGALLTFAPNVNQPVYALAAASGKLFVGGSFYLVNSLSRTMLAAFDLTTLALQTWQSGVQGPVYSLLVSGTLLYAGGEFNSISTVPHGPLAAFDTATYALQTLNPAFGGSLPTIQALALAGTSLYCGGTFSSVGALPRSNLAVLDVNSSSGTFGQALALDAKLGPSVSALALFGGSLFAAAKTNAGQFVGNLQKIDITTGALQVFPAQPNGTVAVLGVQGSNLFVGGSCDSVRTGNLRAALIALDSATGSIAAWLPVVTNGAVPGEAHSLCFSSRLVVGGVFSAIGSVPCGNLAFFDLALTIATASPLSSVTEGTPVNVTFTASGGQGALTWSLGGAPAWLSINPTSGLLSGTPPIGTAPATVSFSVTVNDTASGIDTRPFQFDVTAIPAVVITTASPLPAIPDGAPYSGQFITATGGLPPYTFALSAQPAWLSINSITGELSGNVPAGLGPTNVTFTVTVTHGGPAPGSKNFLLPITSQQPLTITTTSPLPTIAEGGNVNTTLAATGGGPPYSWSLSGAPAWLSVNAANGLLSGVPPAGTAPTTINFTAVVTDTASGNVQKPLSFDVVPALSITTTTLPPGYEGVAFNATVVATGGFTPYSFALTGAPAWLSIATLTGQLTGSPPAAIAPAVFNFTVTVTDQSSAIAPRALSLDIIAIPVLAISTSAQLPDAQVDASYSTTLTAAGGVGTFTWSLPAGPGWLSISSTGVLSGTPPSSAAGTVHFEVRVTDASPTPQTASRMFALNVLPGSSDGEESGKCSAQGGAGWFMLLPLSCLFLIAFRRRAALLCAVCAVPMAAQSFESWNSAPNLNSGTGAPVGRIQGGCVWTGSRMIVWGGNTPGPLVNTGGIYNPATDTWESAPNLNSGTGAPSPRMEFSATWTGNLMIVFGGSSGGTYYNNGGAYDPATDSWLVLPGLANPPVQLLGRVNHTAVWTGSKLIIWGGSQNGPTRYNSGWIYDPAGDSWDNVPNLKAGTGAPVGRDHHSAVWTGSRMLVFGGTAGSSSNQGGSYDPVADTWISAPNLQAGTGAPTGRLYATAIWTGTRMLIWGGADTGTQLGVLTGGTYDPVADTWVTAPNLQSGSGAPAGRFNHVAAWTGEKLIVFGGQMIANYNPGSVFNDGGIYFPALETWQATPNLAAATGAPSVRAMASGAWTGTDLIVWGGISAAGFLGNGGSYREFAPPPLLTVSAISLPNADPNVAYATSLIATGGYQPYLWSQSAGVLPAGMTLDASGQLSGTPTTGSEGLYFFKAEVSDPTNRTANATFSLRVGSAPREEESEEKSSCTTNPDDNWLLPLMLGALTMIAIRLKTAVAART